MRNRILDTPLEPLARSLYLRFSPAHGVRYERQLHVVMRRVLHPYANCLDIGAYRGGVLRDILRYAPHGRHLAFEPVPAQAAYLRQQFPDVTIHAVALSDTTGTAPFHHVVSRPTYSGLRMVQYPSSNEHISLYLHPSALYWQCPRACPEMRFGPCHGLTLGVCACLWRHSSLTQSRPAQGRPATFLFGR